MSEKLLSALGQATAECMSTSRLEGTGNAGFTRSYQGPMIPVSVSPLCAPVFSRSQEEASTITALPFAGLHSNDWPISELSGRLTGGSRQLTVTSPFALALRGSSPASL